MHQRAMSELYKMYCDMIASNAPENRRFSPIERVYLEEVAKLVSGQVAAASVVSQPSLLQSAKQAFQHTAVRKRNQHYVPDIRNLWLVYWHPDECYAVIEDGICVNFVLSQKLLKNDKNCLSNMHILCIFHSQIPTSVLCAAEPQNVYTKLFFQVIDCAPQYEKHGTSHVLVNQRRILCIHKVVMFFLADQILGR